MVSVALVMTRAALERKESRGAHYREDYPDQSEEWMSKRISWRKENDELVMAGGTVETSPH
jgi:succinate dehydrogenase/fumarate reductase flavoprotein subunit